MNTLVSKLSPTEIVELAHRMGTVHYSSTKEKFMSVTEAAPEASPSKNAKRQFATDLLNTHRNRHNVHPTDRLSAEDYDTLASTLSEHHTMELPKAVAYLKNLDTSLRGPNKKADLAGVDVAGLCSQRIPGSSETFEQAITRMRVEEAGSKEDIVKALYDSNEEAVAAGTLNIAILNAVVSAVFKTIKSTKSSKSPGGVPLNDLCLAKYEELTNKYGGESVDSRNRLQGAAASEFNEWYESTRGGKVGNVERTGERMAAHAQWHMNRLLKQKGVLGVYVRPEKPEAPAVEASAEGEAAPKAKRKAAKKSESAEG